MRIAVQLQKLVCVPVATAICTLYRDVYTVTNHCKPFIYDNLGLSTDVMHCSWLFEAATWS